MEDKDYLGEILPQLAEPMLYKWRVQSFSKNKPMATCVAYIDARDVMDRLDNVCIYGWQRDHKEFKDNIYAGIGITLPSGKELWKWDCGSESKEDKEKGEASDSFKRAGVNWGVGRFLYDLEIQYVDANCKKEQGNYPYVVDRGKRVYDLTKFINGRLNRPEDRPKQHNQNKEAPTGNNATIDTMITIIGMIDSKDTGHKWKKENQVAIDKLGPDKGKVMTAYLNKMKEFNKE